jgi:23S rRNA pseudouridine1911/1915/1917 synthase
VHLSQQSRTPLLGDELYGGTSGEAGLVEVARQLGRQALHAKVLGFCHPTTDEQLHFEAPLPEDMRKALDSLRKSA